MSVVPDAVLVLTFWAACGLITYSYLIYPLMMTIRFRSAPIMGGRESPPKAPTSHPHVEVIIAAFNEEAHIRRRVHNLLEQEYEPSRLRIAIGSDGSTDRTNAEGTALRSSRVRFRAFERNRGKASVLNDLVRESNADIIVFTDANTEFAPDAVGRLVAHFDNPAVGAVCGELILRNPKPGINRDHQYWSLERRLKLAESLSGSLLGANGGIYAIRSELYRPLAADTICDDFVIAMNIASGGATLVYDPSALAYEETPTDLREEFGRRVRIGIGNYQAFFRHPEYVLRAKPTRVFAYGSHKVLRWFTPHLLIVALGCSAALVSRAPYGALFAVQLSGYALLAVAYAARQRVRLPAPLSAAVFVAVLNAAFAVGFVRYVTGRYRGGWQRSER